MKIFLSALEASEDIDLSKVLPASYNLISYYYARNKKDRTEKIINGSELIMIDSGAHTFQKGTHVDWEQYTREYAQWIKEHDCEKIVGYFEMDVDNVIGYENVLKLRRILEQASDKIIPVWHKNRGIEDYKKMCRDYAGKVVAITGFKNEDIRDEQYPMFLKYAWANGCKVHCLGMTRIKILDSVPFDYVDSSSWKQGALYGRLNGRKLINADTKEERSIMRPKQLIACYNEAKNMQKSYEQKWAATTRITKERLAHE